MVVAIAQCEVQKIALEVFPKLGFEVGDAASEGDQDLEQGEAAVRGPGESESEPLAPRAGSPGRWNML